MTKLHLVAAAFLLALTPGVALASHVSPQTFFTPGTAIPGASSAGTSALTSPVSKAAAAGHVSTASVDTGNATPRPRK